MILLNQLLKDIWDIKVSFAVPLPLYLISSIICINGSNLEIINFDQTSIYRKNGFINGLRKYIELQGVASGIL